jgi:hypothetical protein
VSTASLSLAPIEVTGGLVFMCAGGGAVINV